MKKLRNPVNFMRVQFCSKNGTHLFSNNDELYRYIREEWSVGSDHQIVIEKDFIFLTNKLGETFACIGEIEDGN